MITYLTIVSSVVILGLISILYKVVNIDDSLKEFNIGKLNHNIIHFDKGIKTTGLPIISIKINNKDYNFIVDSGANVNVIDALLIKEIQRDLDIKLMESDSVTGLSKEEMQSHECKLSFIIDEEEFTDKFKVVDFSVSAAAIKENSDVIVSGLIGSNFLKTHKWQIDFNKSILWKK